MDELIDKIAQQLKDRRIDYIDFRFVSEETCDALASCVMDVVREESKDKISLSVPELSRYSRVFDESNLYFDHKTADIFLRCQENYYNQLLSARGHVFLNEIYYALGLDAIPEGQLVGWLYKGDGDGYIDIGLNSERNKNFREGKENKAVLDFNVDGIIYDKI